MERIKQALDRAKAERDGQGFADYTHDKNREGGRAKGSAIVKLQPRTRLYQPDEKTLAANRVSFQAGQETIEECYRLLRTQVLHRMKENGWHTLGVTSSNPGAGKTVTAINLSIQLARNAQNTVVLVDADLRRPSVHRTLGYQADYGLLEYLTTDVGMDNLLVEPGFDRFLFVPIARPVITGSSELLTSARMTELMKRIEDIYKPCILIFDLPPLLHSDDTLAFAPILDCLLMVAEEDVTSSKDLSRSLDLLERSNVIGTVLNKSKETPSLYY